MIYTSVHRRSDGVIEWRGPALSQYLGSEVGHTYSLGHIGHK